MATRKRFRDDNAVGQISRSAAPKTHAITQVGAGRRGQGVLRFVKQAQETVKFSSSRMAILVGAALLSLALAAPVDAAIRYVNAARPDDTGDGLSWATAKKTLQAALVPAGSGDEIWVAAGTYTPDQGGGQTPGSQTATFTLKNGVGIYGGFVGTEALRDERDFEANPTILSGDLSGDDTLVACVADPECGSSNGHKCVDGSCIIPGNNAENSYHIVNGNLFSNSSAVLDGFTITGANADGPVVPHNRGGAIYIENSSPTIRNCMIVRNRARSSGAGIFLLNNSISQVSNCLLEHNYSENGAGMYIETSNPTVSNCVFSANNAINPGIAMRNINSSPAVTDCTFTKHTGQSSTSNSNASSPIFTNCTFFDNESNSSGAAMLIGGTGTVRIVGSSFSDNSGGGALRMTSAGSAIVTGCEFSGNSSVSDGGAIFTNGIGTLMVTKSQFSGNSAEFNGGAVSLSVSSNLFANCKFVGNSASMGGAIHTGSFTSVMNCTLSGNMAMQDGGGLRSVGGNIFVNSSTFYGNTANGNGGAVHSGGSSLAIDNSVFWGNVDDVDSTAGGPFMDESAQIHTASGAPAVNYSIVQGGWTGAGGAGNRADDPLFVDADGSDEIAGTLDDDLRVQVGSPAIDSGNNSAVPTDFGDLDGDGNTSEPTPIDLGGNQRFLDDPDTPDTGNGTPPIVDMGAYEYLLDCNGNGIMDSVDIANCAGDPACDDCNQNGILDECDIASATSLDEDMNGYPDECAYFAGACEVEGQEDYWTCVDNWDLDGLYPDDVDGAAGIYASVGAPHDVFLDKTVIIPALRLRPGSQLRVTQTGAEGDLLFSERAPGVPGRLLNQGTILIGEDRTVGPVPGALDPEVTIAADGVITGPGCTGVTAGVPVDGTLIAGSLTLTGIDCDAEPCSHGGVLNCCGTMTVIASGDVLIDGDHNYGPCGGHDHFARFGHTPPVKSVTAAAVVNIGGTFTFTGAATIMVDSTEPVILAGDFNNRSIHAECFDWHHGALVLDGTSPQAFEVAAPDVGPVEDLHDAQFAIGELTVAAGAEVTFQDAFDNDQSGQEPCSEALYVGTLTLEANSVITFDNVRVHYQSLVQHPTASVTYLGCAVTAPPEAQPNPDGLSRARFISFHIPPPAVASGGDVTAIRVELSSISAPPGAPSGSQVRYVNAVGFDGSNHGAASINCTDTPAHCPNFACAILGCEPEYRDWAGEIAAIDPGASVIQVTGDAVVPGSTYSVVHESKNGAPSAALEAVTGLWADVVSPIAIVNVLDLGGIKDWLLGLDGSPCKSRAWMRNPPNPLMDINVLDLSLVVNVLTTGQSYPGPPISACP